MKRRNVCQILLSVFGFGAVAKPVLNVKPNCVTPQIISEMIDEITAMCWSVLATVENQNGVWRLHVARHAMQHNTAVIYVDRELRINGVQEVHTGHTGIYMLDFNQMSDSAKRSLVELRVLEMLDDGMDFMFRRNIDAHV
jgi:hypothetical protein